MSSQYSFSYFNCESCASRVNCMHCGAELTEALQKLGVATVSVDMPHKTMEVDPGALSEDDVLDYLETIGVFVG